jgi:hypothetical protein
MTSPQQTTTRPLIVRQFLLPKEGHELSECEDAIGMNETSYRFAVADGATEAFDAGNWARRLAENWVQQTGLLNRDEFWQWLVNEGQALSESWNGQQLAWYSEAKQRIGSFAAFVGVEIDFNLGKQDWKAIALGDSCLVQVRAGRVVDSFPLSDSTSFGSAPVLVPSSAATNVRALNEIAIRSGSLLGGDELLLLSDAVASWYLMLFEQADRETISQFATLFSNEPKEPLVKFLELQRSLGRLKNDDVAIVNLVF